LKIAPLDTRLAGLLRSKAAYEIPIDKLSVDPDQPRKTIDSEELARLTESIRTNGLLHPVGVRWVAELEGYRLIYGERRFKAVLDLGKPTISATVWDRELTHPEILTIQCAENLSRADVKPIEQARSFQTLLSLNPITQAELAREVGVSEGTIAQALRLLDLPDDVQDLVASGRLASSSGYEIAAKVAEPEKQREIAATIVQNDMSRSEAKALIGETIGRPSRAGGSKAKGRGPTKTKLPAERIEKTSTGFKVVVSHRKGFDLLALAEALEEAARQVRAKLEFVEAETTEAA
jgi:ParB family chromosome partitioning protein